MFLYVLQNFRATPLKEFLRDSGMVLINQNQACITQNLLF